MKPGGVIKWRNSSLNQQRDVQELCFCPNSHPEGVVLLFKVQYGWAIKVWGGGERREKSYPGQLVFALAHLVTDV